MTKPLDDGPVATLWMQYVTAVLPDASDAELRVLRRAFYAGAQRLFLLLAALTDLESGDQKRIESVRADLDRFIEEVMSGRA